MTLKILSLLTALLFHGQNVFGQADTLNKLNSKGKKTGYWKIYLNDKADPVDNIVDSYFYGFELWDEGEKVFKYFKHKWGDKMTFEGPTLTKGSPIPLAGTFKSFDKKGRLIIEETYQNGNPLYIKSFTTSHDKTDNKTYLFEDLDFSKKYNNIPGTFYLEEHFHTTGRLDKYWFRKGDRGWRSYKIED